MTVNTWHRRWRRRGMSIVSGLSVVVLATGPTISGSAAAPALPPGGMPAATGADVEPQVLQELSIKGTTTFWVYLRERADLRPAAAIADRTRQGRVVYERLTRTAETSQARLLALLESQRVDFESYWIANTVRVTGDRDLLERVAALPEVAQITADRVYAVPEPAPGTAEPRVDSVEWGVDRINAPEVWSTFGVTGEGIVVATIDTGVQFDHPALVAKYRGNLGDGTFDHNYNWWDPSRVCGDPSLAPCDNNGHGTHVTGTMVGDDGNGNQIGVAPGATWIAAKGCEDRTCSQAALLSSGQFILAPTDLTGANPDPDRRPHVVNNSWGGSATADPWFRPTVEAWVAAGIFPQFSNGNDGPACGTAGNPGNMPEAYAAGAFDINGNIYVLSSRGPSAFGEEVKPNIAAPGVNVRSAWNDGGYRAATGTSMASPHVAGTVALLWSAAPALVRDVAATRELLDQTAIDTPDVSCGGTAERNNVWGEGRLDAFAAVAEAPRGPSGRLAGTVVDADTGQPIAGAQVTISGEVDRVRVTAGDGTYAATLPVGEYVVTVSRFGYLERSADVTIVEAETRVLDVALTPAPTWRGSGPVRDPDGVPVAGATVTIEGTPLEPVTTGADGSYDFDAVPAGTYHLRADAGRCHGEDRRELVVSGDSTLDLTLPWLTDDHGYQCQEEDRGYVEGDTPLGLSGLDEWVAHPLPFEFPFYGERYATAYISTKGYVTFLEGNAIFSNTALPNAARPNAAVYAFWDDLEVDDQASTWTGLIGVAPQREYVIEWRNVTVHSGDVRLDVGIVLHENGDIRLQYRGVGEDPRERGLSATIGIEDPTGTVAHQYSFQEAVLPVGESVVRYRLPGHAFLRGTVTDGSEPVAGAAVVADAGEGPVAEATTGDDGTYVMWLPLGTYLVTVSAAGYATVAEPVTLDEEGSFVTLDVDLDRQREGYTWYGDFFGPGVDSVVYATAVWDDGTGPALYVGGAFDTVGGQVVNGIAKWDGTGWSPLGDGVDGIVEVLAVYNGQLIAGGSFRHAGGVEVNGIAAWDGEQWHPLGGGLGGASPPIVWALTVFDGDLVAGGNFLQAGGQTVNRIARWDGTRWAPLGTGMNNRVEALTVYRRELIAAGAFTQAGGTLVNRVARWDGNRWAPLSGPTDVGVDAVVMSLAVYDGALVAGGVFRRAGGVEANLVAQWDGEQWSALGDGFDSVRTSSPSVRSLTVYDGGLVAAGSFTHTGDLPVNQVARWDGDGWSALGDGLDGVMPHLPPHAYTLTVYGDLLIAGGSFTDAGDLTVNGIAAWDGERWSGLSGAGGDRGPNRFPFALAEFDGDLVVGGDFSHAGGRAVGNLARWDGQQWHAMSSGLSGVTSGVAVHALVEFEGELIAAGHFTHIDGVEVNHVARWDGERWHPLAGPDGVGVGGPPGASVLAMAVFNGDLIVAGHFSQAGGVPASHIARWDGERWHPLGSGLGHRFTAPAVSALLVHDGALVAGGEFLLAGGRDANYVARWDGEQWSPLVGPGGNGVNARVDALAEYDGDLVLGGAFTSAGGVPASRIARWDGERFSALGTGLDGGVRALTVFDGDLVAGGDFRHAGGHPADFVASWNGVAWSSLAGTHGTGTNSTVLALLTLSPGPVTDRREALAVGGAFSIAGGMASWGLALYGPVAPDEPEGIVLEAEPRRDRGLNVVDLSWQGATSSLVEVYRNGHLVAVVPNDGVYTDRVGRGQATYVYRVCELGTATCSNEVTVRFGGQGPAGGPPPAGTVPGHLPVPR